MSRLGSFGRAERVGRLCAANSGHYTICKYLLEKDARTNIVDTKVATADCGRLQAGD